MSQRSILITGCSSGIGHCAANTLKQRGYRVFAAVRNPEDKQKLESLGLESILIDLNQPESIKSGLNEVLTKTNGTLDAVFNKRMSRNDFGFVESYKMASGFFLNHGQFSVDKLSLENLKRLS